MKISLEGLSLIKKFEGCKLEAYKCSAGVWTIGYGHTTGVKEGDVCTQEEAEKLLLDNVERKIKQKAGQLIKDIEEESTRIAKKRATEILISSMQRTAVDVLVSHTTSVVALPDDELKGRVI